MNNFKSEFDPDENDESPGVIILIGIIALPIGVLLWSVIIAYLAKLSVYIL